MAELWTETEPSDPEAADLLTVAPSGLQLGQSGSR